MAELPCIRGEIALVDEEDLARLLPYRWRIVKVGRKTSKQQRYVAARIGDMNNVYLHRFLMQPEPGQIVDHVNRNPLDCRRQNMRIVTKIENAQNKSKHATWRGRPTFSKYRGVMWSRQKRMWFSRIQSDYKYWHLGFFLDEISAAEAYDDSSMALHEEHGNRNFPDRIPMVSTGLLLLRRSREK